MTFNNFLVAKDHFQCNQHSIYQGSPDFRYFIPKFTMGNVKSKRTLDISSTPKKDGVAVKVKIVTMRNIQSHRFESESFDSLLIKFCSTHPELVLVII